MIYNSFKTYEYNGIDWFLLASLDQVTQEKNEPQEAICQIQAHIRS